MGATPQPRAINLESFVGNDADTLASDLRDGEAPVRLPVVRE